MPMPQSEDIPRGTGTILAGTAAFLAALSARRAWCVDGKTTMTTALLKVCRS